MQAQASSMKSITELERMGYSKEFLYRVCHMPCSPMFRTSANGKFYVMYDKFLEFISQRRIGK